MKLIAPLAVLVLAASPAVAQQLEVPHPSPSAKVVQTVGITDISVEYSSPAVRGRQIWGSLVPYGEVWRAGANASTKVTFSKDVTVGSTPVPAGSYSFFVIPTQGKWTLILSKDVNQSGAFGYKQSSDVVRVDVTPETIPLRERLAYLVSNFTEDAASLDLEWEKVRVSLPIKLATDAEVAASMKAVEDGAWEPYNAYANFLRTVKKDYDGALSSADKSIKLHETWQNVWTKAQIEAAQGRKKSARAAAEKAQKLAGPNGPKFFLDEVAKALKEWQ